MFPGWLSRFFFFFQLKKKDFNEFSTRICKQFAIILNNIDYISWVDATTVGIPNKDKINSLVEIGCKNGEHSNV